MKKATFCPLIKKDCIEHKCLWYSRVSGTNPNTGEPIEEWTCVINMLPILIIENAKRTRNTNIAVESLRNETAKQNDSINQAISGLFSQSFLPVVREADIKILPEQAG
jgi:hypothetical protein